ncbi:MAG: PQQ-binding-like beta-propeller repeat protein [Planctomycetes bacterium]|nr:PQQ-binding-like beta-propeller repeat protein [Planctomycetota bacterium]
MKTVKMCCFVMMIFGLFAGTSLAADWPHYLGPNFDLKPLAKEFNAKSGTIVWDAKVNTGMCSLTVADGLVYTMGNDGNPKDKDKSKAKDFVYCLDAKTGNEEWKFDYSCLLEPRLHPGGPSSTPTIHEGKVYTLSKLGHIFCLDAKTGDKLWEATAVHYKPKKAWWGFAASPTIVGDVVIYNIGDRGLALNKDTGEIVWKSEKNVVGYATPKPLPSRIFKRPAVALFTNEGFHVLDPATGKTVAAYEKMWQEKSNCNAITPYIHKGHIYLIHSGHGMARLSLDGDRFKQDWLSEDAKYPNEWFAFNTHVIYRDNIYFLTNKESGLSCVDAKTGERKWFDEKYDFGNLLRVRNKLIMLSEKGELIWGKVSKTAFDEAHRQKILDGLCWSKPILLGNLLYARSAEGSVVCLKLE